jgi:hypothetical protein
MGLTGAYGIWFTRIVAGQLFGLLVGFGTALFKKTLTAGPQPFSLFKRSQLRENIMDIIVLITAVITLGTTFVYSVVNKYKLSKTLALALYSIFGVFMTACTCIAIIQIY